MKSWKNECRIRFLRKKKTVLSVKWKVVKKWLVGIKKGWKKIYHVENDQKRSFYEKMFVRIKDDRNSVTRPKSENSKNEKIELG